MLSATRILPGRRGLTIALHWALFLLLLMMIKGGSAAPLLRWSYVAVAGLWVGLALARGLAGQPGPKLSGAARAAYGPMHWGLYGLIALTAVLNAAELGGLIAEGPAWTSLLVLLCAGTFHALFHFWRHNVLRDNALRTILPRSLHHIL